jgi:hypothetical protein
MSKKTKRKRPARATRASRPTYRNAAPSSAGRTKATKEETPLSRIGYTVAGAGAAALAVTMLEHEKWEPKKVAGLLGLGGAALAWKSNDKAMKSIGLGVSSAAGAQLALLVMNDHDKKLATANDSDAQNSTPTQSNAIAQNNVTAQRPANSAQALPPGSLEAALARAQARLALAEGDGA